MEKANEKQAASLQLSKNSTPEVITNYFKKILELKQSGKEFPINLNDAWALAYGRKEDAVRALKNNFIENVHYQVLRQNAENPKGGRPIDEYWLSVGCLEYFIASKVHPVFEVYRKVFHAAVESSRQQQNYYNEIHLDQIVGSLTRKEKRLVSRFLLQRTELMQKDVARLLSVSEKTMVKWVNGVDKGNALAAFSQEEALHAEIMDTILDVTNKKTRKTLYDQFNKLTGGLV